MNRTSRSRNCLLSAAVKPDSNSSTMAMARQRMPWTYWPFRLVVTVATVLLVGQPIYADQSWNPFL
jgi:hypothetical protein